MVLCSLLPQGSPEFVDDNGCMVIIEFFTKEACKKKDDTKEIPCVIYNPTDKKKRDLSPLIKLSGLYETFKTLARVLYQI